METVHGNSQSLVGFLGYGPVGHSACLKPLHDGFNAFDLIYVHAIFGIVKVKYAPDITCLFLIDHGSVLLELTVITLSCGTLEHVDRLRVVAVLLALGTQLVPAEGIRSKIALKS